MQCSREQVETIAEETGLTIKKHKGMHADFEANTLVFLWDLKLYDGEHLIAVFQETNQKSDVFNLSLINAFKYFDNVALHNIQTTEECKKAIFYTMRRIKEIGIENKRDEIKNASADFEV